MKNLLRSALAVLSCVLGIGFAPASAGTVTQESSFLLGFTDVSGLQTVDVAFDPFSGDPDTLEAVDFAFDSRAMLTALGAPDQFSLSVRLPGPYDFVYFDFVNTGTFDFSDASELLGRGYDKALFTDGPVVFTFGAFIDEAAMTGVWYGGTGVPFLGADPFGSLSLSYTFTDPAPVPLPAGLPLLIAGCLGLRALRFSR